MTYFYEFIRDDGTTVTVEYSAQFDPGCMHGPPESCSPPELEVEIEKVFSDMESGIKLTDAENERAIEAISENFEPDYGDESDYL